MPLGRQLATIHVDEVADRRKRVERQSRRTGETGAREKLRGREAAGDGRDRGAEHCPSRYLRTGLQGGPFRPAIDEQARAVRHGRHGEQQSEVLDSECGVEEQARRHQQQPAITMRDQVIGRYESGEKREEPERVEQHL